MWLHHPGRAQQIAAREVQRNAMARGRAFSEQVYIVGLVLLDSALDFGHCRLYEFDLLLEACSPGGCGMETPCKLVGKWDW